MDEIADDNPMNIRMIFWPPLLLVAAGCGSPRPTENVENDDGTAACSTTDGTAVVNGLLESLTPVLNSAWPSVAVSFGLDPLENPMVNEKVPLKCSYGGDEACGLQLAKCKEEYALVTVSTIRGLAYMQFKDLAMSSLIAQSGTQACPYSASGGGAYDCSYAGTGTGSAFLINNEVITANVSAIKVKVKCESVTTWTETLFSGSAQCTGSEPEGTGTFQLCGGSCSSGSAANLSYTALNKLNLKLGKLSCKVSPSYNPVSWVGDALAPAIKDDLMNEITPAVQKAINSMVADDMPFPSTCGS
jgi:hypothetical protein